MMMLFGLLVGMGSIFGGFALAGGKFGPLWQPTEILMIVGAGVGAFLMANNGKVIHATGHTFSKLSHTKKYKKAIYMDMLSMQFLLLDKLRREGVKALEKEIESPEESKLFKAFPVIAKDPMIMEFMSDYMRLLVTGAANPIEVDELMLHEIEAFEHEANIPAEALQKVGDALPAFGIVAAVMGVVKALSYAGAGADQMGAMIGHALVGTFLGILLAYGVVNPIATRIQGQVSDAVMVLQCIRVTMLAYLNGAAPQIAVEFGRKALHADERPTFQELEDYVLEAKDKIK